MRRKMLAGFCLLVMTSACAAADFQPGDVPRAEELLREQYAALPGVELQHVELIREAPSRLTGFARVKAAGKLWTLKCHATMGQDDRYIVACDNP